jgi:hypothetical protein
VEGENLEVKGRKDEIEKKQGERMRFSVKYYSENDLQFKSKI